MKLVVFYRNQPEFREEMVKHLLHAHSQNFDFQNHHLKHPFFQTFHEWPRADQLAKLPLWIQVEELEIIDGRIHSLRVLIIDISPASDSEQLELNIGI